MGQIPELGLVCITHGEEVRFRTITRKYLLSFAEEEQREKLQALYTENVLRLGRAVDYCAAAGIRLYRLSSDLFPFADEPIGREILEEFTAELASIGGRATRNGLRMVIHPDQFVVLSSDTPSVVENSVKLLKMHAAILDLLQQPRSEWATMNIHGGKADRTDRLVAAIAELPENVHSRISFENDEYSYRAVQILEVCQRAGVRMVFDAHHHVIREKLDSYEHESVGEMLFAAATTWANPENQIVHISNGRAKFSDRSHSDVIDLMPSVFRHAPWIEIEAKQKEVAIEQLRRVWLCKQDLPEGGQAVIVPQEK
jgi:UV DNA damage endonuclease